MVCDGTRVVMGARCDRLSPTHFGQTDFGQTTLAKIGVSIFGPNHKEQEIQKKNKMSETKRTTNKETKTAAGQTKQSVVEAQTWKSGGSEG